MLIDFTNHAAQALEMFGIDRDSIRHLLITHGHHDHFRPLEIMRFGENLPHRLTVYGNTMVKDALEFCAGNRWDAASGRFVAAHNAFNLLVKVLAPGMTVAVGDARVTAVLANHFIDKRHSILEQQALNFIIERNSKVLFYGLDSSYMLPETFEMLSNYRFDVAILDATFGPRQIDPATSGHQNWAMFDETIAEFRRAGLLAQDAVIVADHVSVRHVEPYDEVGDRLREKGITLAYDGLVLEL